MDFYHTFLKKLAHFQVQHPYVTLLLLIALTLAIFGGVSQVKTVASLEQMMPADVEEIKAFNVLRDNYLGQDMLAIILEVDSESSDLTGVMDIRDKRVLDYLKYLRLQLLVEPDVLQVYDYSTLFPDQQTADEYSAQLKDPSITSMLQNYVNDEASVTMLILTTDVSADDTRMNYLAEKIQSKVSSIGHPPGVKLSFTGTPIIQQKLGELITADRTNTQWISTLFVFIITMIIFGTFTSALVPIIVVTVSVNWLYGTMGYTGLPISTLAGGVAAMVVGIGIDFAIHIMNKFKLERKKGLSIPQSIELAVVEVGTALTATSLTTIGAFLAFLIGRMPEMGRFGILMAIGITFSLIFSIFGLPALLIIEEKVIALIKPKMHFGVEGEFQMAEEKELCHEPTKRKKK